MLQQGCRLADCIQPLIKVRTCSQWLALTVMGKRAGQCRADCLPSSSSAGSMQSVRNWAGYRLADPTPKISGLNQVKAVRSKKLQGCFH